MAKLYQLCCLKCNNKTDFYRLRNIIQMYKLCF